MSEADAVFEFVNKKINEIEQGLKWGSSQSRASLARLRQAVNKKPEESPNVWDITLQGAPDTWDSKGGEPSNAEMAVHNALTLYAVHRQGKHGRVSEDKVSFGRAASRLKVPSIGDDDANKAIIRRFNSVITAANIKELSYHARGMIQLFKAAKGDGICMDYPMFARDLYFFQTTEGKNNVRLKWGRDFYKTYRDDIDENGNEENEEGMDE